MLLIVKLDQGVRNGFFFGKIWRALFWRTTEEQICMFIFVLDVSYIVDLVEIVFSTYFFLSANVYAKCFILLFIASFALLRCQLFFFRNLTGHSFPAFFFRKSIATISLFTFFVISFFAWRCFRTRSRVFSRHFFASSLFRSSTLT